mmetsp:Transcript_7354/g.18609  ORF Transcript_7354/g.18609 Transcript_7354/m.18609 type:complete len:772 (+) Transcript_7354:133-2448(+)
MEGGRDEDEDEAAFIDAFFLPGGILDPEEEGNNKELTHAPSFEPPPALSAERADSTPATALPSASEGAAPLLFVAPKTPEPSSWLEPATTPAEASLESPWLEQHLLGQEDIQQHGGGFDSAMGQGSTGQSSDDLMNGTALASVSSAIDQPPSLAALAQLESTNPPISAWMPSSTEQWNQQHADTELLFHEAPEQESSSEGTKPIHIPTKPPPGFERAPLLAVEKPSLSAEAPSFQPASTLMAGREEKAAGNKSQRNTSDESRPTESVGDVKKERTHRRRLRGRAKKTKSTVQNKPAVTADIQPQRQNDAGETKNENTIRSSEKEKPPEAQHVATLKRNKNVSRPKSKPQPARSPAVHKSEEKNSDTAKNVLTPSRKAVIPTSPHPMSTPSASAPAKKPTQQPKPAKINLPPPQVASESDAKKETKRERKLLLDPPQVSSKSPESDKVAEAHTAAKPLKLEVSPPLEEPKRFSPNNQKQNGKRKQKRQQEFAKEKRAESTPADEQEESAYRGLGTVVGVAASGVLYVYETCQVVYEFFHQYILWVSEILLPALKQSALLIASSALHSLRGVFLVLFAAFHTYSFAADETLAELNLESAWIPYVALVYAPTAARHMMNFVDLPQFTPHLVSSAVLCFLFRPVGVKRVSPSAKPTPDDLRNILLICCQVLIPVDLLMDGFASVNTGIMTLCYADRLLLAYLISVIRKGWILSPFAWLSFSVQCLASLYFPWRHILAEPILLFVLFSIGMASLNVLRSLEQMKQRAKKAKSLATQ